MPGFEPGSEAPEAPMLSKLYYKPLVVGFAGERAAGGGASGGILRLP